MDQVRLELELEFVGLWLTGFGLGRGSDLTSAVASCNCLAKMLAFALLWTTAVSKSDKINVAIQYFAFHKLGLRLGLVLGLA